MFPKYKILYKSVLILSIIGLILPEISFAQTQIVKLPENFEELKEMGLFFLKTIKEKLLSNIEKIWKEEVIPVWQKMYEWSKNIWEKYIWPWLENIWYRILSIFMKEAEMRKPIFEEEFQKEKEELKEELPQVQKSLWERFRELLR